MTLNFGPALEENLQQETQAPLQPRCRLRNQVDPRKIPLGSHPNFPVFLQKIAHLIMTTYPDCHEPFFRLLDEADRF